jgi:hypothetical protein
MQFAMRHQLAEKLLTEVIGSTGRSHTTKQSGPSMEFPPQVEKLLAQFDPTVSVLTACR